MRRRTSWTCRRSSSRVRSVAGWRSVRLEDIDPVPVEGGRILWRPVRRMLDLGAFGINAFIGPNMGDDVVEEHAEEMLGLEEVYVVLTGRATFKLDGETLDAPPARSSSSTTRRSDGTPAPRSRRQPFSRSAAHVARSTRHRHGRPSGTGRPGTSTPTRTSSWRRSSGDPPTGSALRRRRRGGPRGPLRRRQRPPAARARAPSDAGGLGPRERGSRLAPGPPGLAGCTEMTSRATLPPYRHRR
jgi:hypothetical protein